jgi:hypothetical protein
MLRIRSGPPKAIPRGPVNGSVGDLRSVFDLGNAIPFRSCHDKRMLYRQSLIVWPPRCYSARSLALTEQDIPAQGIRSSAGWSHLYTPISGEQSRRRILSGETAILPAALACFLEGWTLGLAVLVVSHACWFLGDLARIARDSRRGYCRDPCGVRNPCPNSRR